MRDKTQNLPKLIAELGDAAVIEAMGGPGETIRKAVASLTPEQQKKVAIQYAGDGILTLNVETVAKTLALVLGRTDA
jgi:hypothetical protein